MLNSWHNLNRVDVFKKFIPKPIFHQIVFFERYFFLCIDVRFNINKKVN